MEWPAVAQTDLIVVTSRTADDTTAAACRRMDSCGQ